MVPRRAKSLIEDGLERLPAVALLGPRQVGKTTLVRSLLLNRMPDNADVAVVLNPQLSVVEFLATICEELHIEVLHNKGSAKALTDALNRHLPDLKVS